MVDFLFWGFALNLYFFTFLIVILFALKPKNYVSKKSKDDNFKRIIYFTSINLIPFLAAFLSIVAFLTILNAGFKWEKIEEIINKN